MTRKPMNFTAEDIMTTPVVTTPEDAPLSDAATIMVERNIGCIPVVDSSGKFVGMVSERTFQVGLIGVRPESSEDFQHRIIHRIYMPGSRHAVRGGDDFMKTKNTAVGKYVTADVPTLSRDTPLWRIAEILLEGHLSHLAVLEDGKPVGVVARHDLIKAYSMQPSAG